MTGSRRRPWWPHERSPATRASLPAPPSATTPSEAGVPAEDEQSVRGRGQWVIDSVVFGSVVQVSDTVGNVSISVGSEHALYRVASFPLGRPQLTVEQAHARPARLLQARYAVVDFTGRRAALERLADWRNSPERVSVLLLHGTGGQGKTRLAAEFARASHERGWQVLQARHASDPAPITESPGAGPAPDRPRDGRHGAGVLMVADYAERWPVTDLREMLTDATRQGRRPARVLLIARPAGIWWQTLANRLDRLELPAADLLLRPLADEPDISPEGLFTTARDCFATALDVPRACRLPPPETLRQDPMFQQVLAVHMAALATVDNHRQHPGDATARLDSPARVSGYLLLRERDHWQTLHDNGLITTPVDTLAHAAYTAALTHALPHDDGRAALARIGACAASAANQVLIDHAVAYPSTSDHTDTVLEPLYPDQLAEDFLALTTPGHQSDDYTPDPWAVHAPQRLLAGPPAPGASTATTGSAWTRTALNVLIAAADRWPHLTTTQLTPLLTDHPELMLHAGGAALAALSDLDHLGLDVLQPVETLLPENPHTDLDSGAAALTARLAPHRLAATYDPAEHARTYNHLAIRQSRAGLHEQALQSGHQMLKICRRLAEEDPAHEPDLAASLTNIGRDLSKVGRWEEALPPSEEAVQIFRRLAEEDPAAYTPDLATSLANHGVRLSEVGRWQEALEAEQQAVELRRRLTLVNPAAHEPDLAASLQNLGVRLAQAGRPEEALPLIEEAVQIFRRLAEADPAAHEPDLAASLHDVGICLSDMGWRTEKDAEHGVFLRKVSRPEDALAATEQAVEIRQRLARINPAAYESDLAVSLSSLGERLAEAGRQEEGLQAQEQAAGIQRRMAQANPAAYESDLAVSLFSIGRGLRLAGRWEEALQAIGESVEIFGRLDEELPAVFRGNLNVALFGLASVLDRLGRAEEAHKTRGRIDVSDLRQ